MPKIKVFVLLHKRGVRQSCFSAEKSCSFLDILLKILDVTRHHPASYFYCYLFLMNSKSFRILEHAKAFPSKLFAKVVAAGSNVFNENPLDLLHSRLQKSSVWWKRRRNYHKIYTFLIVSSSWNFSEITIPARCAFYDPSGETRLKMPCEKRHEKVLAVVVAQFVAGFRIRPAELICQTTWKQSKRN